MHHQLEASLVFRYVVQHGAQSSYGRRDAKRAKTQHHVMVHYNYYLFIYFKIQLVLPLALQDFPALPTSPIRLSGDRLVP
jgi:hypothetical protein